MKQRLIRYAIMVIALGVFVYSAYRLTLIYIESKDSLEVYDEVKNMFLSGEAGGEAETDEKGMTISNSNNGGKFVWDYDKMLAYNPEAVGYIRQDNGEYIDNPILLHSDNEYYLNHLANNQVSSVGSIFVDYRITEGLEARNAIIYGHNMGKRVNNIMFGSLNWYYYCDSDPEYYKNHPTFDVYVGYKHYKYYVFAVYKTEAEGGWTYTYSFENDEAFLKYVNDCKTRSKYTFEQAGEITAQDKIITLSTCCESDDKRMIVQAVRREQIDDVPNVPEGEAAMESRSAINIGVEGSEETTVPVETQPAETQAPEQKPAETQAPETQAETQAPETKPPETQAPETKPPETTTVPPETTAVPPETTTAPPETTTGEADVTPVEPEAGS